MTSEQAWTVKRRMIRELVALSVVIDAIAASTLSCVAFRCFSAVVMIQMPPFHTFLGMQPLHWDDWGFVMIGSAAAAAIAAAPPIMERLRVRPSGNISG